MSVLNKIRYAIDVKTPRIYKSHPLANKSLEDRLQYLTAVAFVLAVDREPNHFERAAFIELARGLDIGEIDAKEQLQDRANVSTDDVKIIFDKIKEEKYSGYYFIDISWIHMLRDDIKHRESNEIFVALAELLNINNDCIGFIPAFLQAIKNKDTSEKNRCREVIFRDKLLRDAIKMLR